MAIVIEAEKIIIRGVKYFELTRVKALPKDRLPVEYTDDREGHGPTVYQDGPGAIVHRSWEEERNHWGNLVCQWITTRYDVGQKLTVSEWNVFISRIAHCGKRLQKINRRLAKENAGWKGEIEVII